MMRGIATLFIFVSVIFFPWPLVALLAVALASLEPLMPLAVGLFADTLYFAPAAQSLPFFSIAGAVVTIIAFLVRSRMRTGTIR
jgi:hypothetical protein